MSEAIHLYEEGEESSQAVPATIGRGALRLVAEGDVETKNYPSAEELYSGILSVDHFPRPETLPDARGIEAKIITNHSLVIDSERIVLHHPQMVFFFNSLMLLRDEPRFAKEYRELGYGGRSGGGYNSSRFHASISGVIKRVNKAAGEDVITIGKAPLPWGGYRNVYNVSPNLQLVDERYGRASRPPQMEKRKLPLPLKAAVDFERAEFATTKDRDAAFQAILRTYGDSPRIYELLEYVSEPRETPWEKSEAVKAIDSLGGYRVLLREEIRQLYDRIERGLSIYQDLGGNLPAPSYNGHASEISRALEEAAVAYNVVHNCNLRLAIAKTLDRFPIEDPLFLDCLQHAVLSLGTAVRGYDYKSGYAFSTYAINWIKQGIQRGYVENARSIHLPADVDLDWNGLKSSETFLSVELQRTPTAEELSEFTGRTVLENEELRRLGPRNAIESLSRTVDSSDDESAELIDFIPDEDIELRSMLEVGDSHGSIWQRAGEYISTLPPSYKLYLSLRFKVYLPELEGTYLGRNERGHHQSYGPLMQRLHEENSELSYANIAKMFGVREDTVQTAINKSINRIQKALEATESSEEPQDETQN